MLLIAAARSTRVASADAPISTCPAAAGVATNVNVTPSTETVSLAVGFVAIPSTAVPVRFSETYTSAVETVPVYPFAYVEPARSMFFPSRYSVIVAAAYESTTKQRFEIVWLFARSFAGARDTSCGTVVEDSVIAVPDEVVVVRSPVSNVAKAFTVSPRMSASMNSASLWATFAPITDAGESGPACTRSYAEIAKVVPYFWSTASSSSESVTVSTVRSVPIVTDRTSTPEMSYLILVTLSPYRSPLRSEVFATFRPTSTFWKMSWYESENISLKLSKLKV